MHHWYRFVLGNLFVRDVSTLLKSTINKGDSNWFCCPFIWGAFFQSIHFLFCLYFHLPPRGCRKTLVLDVTYSILLCSEDLIGFMKAFSFLSVIGRRHGVQSKACFRHLIDPDCFVYWKVNPICSDDFVAQYIWPNRVFVFEFMLQHSRLAFMYIFYLNPLLWMKAQWMTVPHETLYSKFLERWKVKKYI